ncbi:GATA transcription factor 11 [Sesamum angolense]|uniref:GATA transcription factor 11 n=1 Tax=Sesamum angolense TaxID=2727404 RepID=A0AAE2C484_9LAMI|nr:GATA transcription factor 11 [Sesamum angolense]
MGEIEPYNCWDGVVDGAAGDEEFDNILSILDFPMDSLEGDGFVGDWDVTKSQYLGPIPSDVLMGPPATALSKIDTAPPVLVPVPAAHIDGTPEPKQLPYQLEDTSGLSIHRQNKFSEVQEQGVFRTRSPISVLENSGPLAGKSPLIKTHTGKRTRSKRARPSGVSPWLLMSPPLAPPSASRKTHDTRKTKEWRRKSSSFRSSLVVETMQDSSHTTKNQLPASDHVEPQNAAPQRPAIVKKCTHCEVTKTPQWREGPLGPKTLCNACGVRYRSGRLFPEYRPAASPTFVPSLHSNSHKKVVEMRSKAKQQVNNEERPVSPQMEFIPMSSHLFDPVC